MKTFIIAKRSFMLPVAVVLALLSSCIRESEHSVMTDAAAGEATVTFSVDVPGNAIPDTRGLSSNDETNVETIDILLFNDNGSGDRVYYDKVVGVSIDNSPGKIKTFQAVIPVKDYNNFDISVLANSRDMIVNTTLAKGTPKHGLLNSLVKTVAAGEKWDSNEIPMWGESVNVTVSTDTNLSGTNSIKLVRMVSRIDVRLTDMAASGEDNPAIPNNNNFKLNSVRLYNYSTNGTVVPDLVSGWDSGSGKATAAHCPSIGFGKVLYEYLVTDPLTYTVADQPADGTMPTNLIRSIYTFEASAGSGSGMLENTCLVIGGYYNNSMDESYYRIDFAKKNTSTNTYEYLSLMRNHLYDIKVTKISGAGFETPDEAFKSLPVNIETEISEWNQGNMGDTVFDGQYLLSIRPGSQMEFSKDSELKTVEIRTDYPTGWKVTKITELNADGVTEKDVTTGGGWLSLPSNAINIFYGSDGQYTGLDVSVKQNPNNANRTGYIYIQAGRLTARIEVIQTDSVNSMLSITDAAGNEIDALFFYSAVGINPNPNTFKVKWSPQTEALHALASSVGKPGSTEVYDPIQFFSYDVKSGTLDSSGNTVYVNSINSGAGIAEFIVLPSVIDSKAMESDPLYERRTSVTFSINTPDGQIHKTIILQQVVNCAIIEKESFYLANGDWYSFTVKSNSPWRLYFIDNGGGMIELPTVNPSVAEASGFYNLPLGRQVTFKTLDDLSDPVKFEGTGIVHLQYQAADGTWHNARETDGSIDLQLLCGSGRIQPLSNCYIINSKMPILIPVKRANGYRTDTDRDVLWTNGDQIGGSTEYTAELVWSDRTGTGGKGLASDGTTPVRLLYVAGTGDTGYILVQGGAEGNALVAAKVNGTIVWTWHIWVVDYWPYDALGNAYGSGTNNAWMDRNLGATGNGYKPGTSTLETSDAERLKATGLYYQWGRFTPFPGMQSWTLSSMKPVYTANGAVYPITRYKYSVNSNILTAISNPNIFYGADNGNWYGSDNKTFWADSDTKTIYDPCPAGWRVPRMSGGAPMYSGANWVDATKGRVSSAKGGYYPYTGVLLDSSFLISAHGKSAYNWTTSNNGSTSFYYLNISNDYFVTNAASSNTYGRSVRCAKDESVN